MHRGRRVLKWVVGICAVGLLVLLSNELVARMMVNVHEWPTRLDRSFSIYRPEKERRHPYSCGCTNIMHIAVIGDSWSVGNGVQRYDRYASQLEELLNLNEKPRPVETLVFAKPSAAYQQQDFFRKAFEHEPEIIIWALCLDDVEDWSGTVDLRACREAMSAHKMKPWLRPVVKHSCLASALYRTYESERIKRARLRYYDLLYDPSYSGQEKLRETVEWVRDQCAERDIQVFAAIIPLISYDLREGRYPFVRHEQALQKAVTEAGVPCIDLYDAFCDMSSARLTNIPDLDPHPNEIAHRIVAEALFEHLVDDGLVDKHYKPREVVDRRMQEIWAKKWRVTNRDQRVEW